MARAPVRKLTKLSNQLVPGIVRVVTPDGGQGTGFVVSEDGLILTCSYVVQPPGLQEGRTEISKEVEVVFRVSGKNGKAKVLSEYWRPWGSEDIAVLRLKDELPEGVAPLPLGACEGVKGHAFSTFGFPQTGAIDGVPGNGHVTDDTTHNGAQVWEITSDQVTEGFSGAPVWDDLRDRVIGMVSVVLDPDERKRLGRVGFMVPTETIRSICPALGPCDRSPYVGLLSFTGDDEDIFFGRDEILNSLIDRLRNRPHFLAIVGPSGCGKSSLIRAGLIPALQRGAIAGSARWEVISINPKNGSFQQLDEAGLDGVGRSLAESVERRLLRHHDDSSHLVLVVDQLEQLLASHPEQETQVFLDQVWEVVGASLSVSVIFIMRDDFLSSFVAMAPTSCGWLENGMMLIPPVLTHMDLTAIIEGPANYLGWRFERGLVELIVNDAVAAQPAPDHTRAARSSVLPLIESALSLLWDQRTDGLMTHQAYRAIGGVARAITQKADKAYGALDENDRYLARRILTGLVELGDRRRGTADTRRRKLIRDCYPGSESSGGYGLVQYLATARLVVTSRDEDERVEIIHDALLREWHELRGWIDEDRRFLEWRQGIDSRVRSWVDTCRHNPGQRSEGRLLQDLDLAEAEGWLNERQPDLADNERAFIEASVGRRQRETAQQLAAQERRRWRVTLGLAVGLVISLALTAFAVLQWRNAEAHRQQALGRQLAAQAVLALTDDPALNERSTLLAIESARRIPSTASDQALRLGLSLLPFQAWNTGDQKNITNAAWSHNGRYLATASSDKSIRLWDAVIGTELLRWAHDEWIDGVLFSPDDRYLATADFEGTVVVREVPNGREIARTIGNGRITTLAFTPDQRSVVMALNSFHGEYRGGRYREAQVWEIATAQLVATVTLGGDSDVTALSANGALVAATNANRRIVVLDAENGLRPIGQIDSDSDVRTLSVSSDGGLLAAADSGGNVRVWNTTGLELVASVFHPGTHVQVVFSPDDRYLATSDANYLGERDADRTALVWEIATGHRIMTATHSRPVGGLLFSLNSQYLATTGYDRTTRVWQMSTGREMWRVSGTTSPWAHAFSPSNEYLVVSEEDHPASVWHLTDAAEVVQSGRDGAWGMALSPDGSYLAAVGEKGPQLWKTASWQETPLLRDWDPSIRSYFGTPTFSPDGHYLLDSGFLRDSTGVETALVWEVPSGKKVGEMTVPNGPVLAGYSPEGQPFVLVRTDDSASLFDVRTQQEIAHVDLPQETFGFELSATGDRLMVIRRVPGATIGLPARSSELLIYQIPTLQQIASLVSDVSIIKATFSPDGKFVAASDGNGSVRALEVSTGREVARLDRRAQVIAESFSGSSRYLAVSYTDKVTEVLDLGIGEPVATLNADQGANAIALTRDGDYLAMATANVERLEPLFLAVAYTEPVYFGVEIWNTRTGEKVSQIAADGFVLSIAFTRDSRKLLVGSADSLRVLPWRSDDLAARACSRLTRNLTPDEWQRFLPGEPYSKTCPELGGG